MHDGDEASPSMILAGLALLVKMFMTLERRGIFGSNLFILFILYLCILTLYSHWYAKQ